MIIYEKVRCLLGKHCGDKSIGAMAFVCNCGRESGSNT